LGENPAGGSAALFDRLAGRIHLKLNNRIRLAGQFADSAGERPAMPAVQQISDERVAHDDGVLIADPADHRGLGEISGCALRADQFRQPFGDPARNLIQ